MAWVLQFDGVNDYVTVNIPAAVNSGGFDTHMEFSWAKLSGDSYIIGNSGIYFLRLTGSLFQVFCNSSKVAEWDLSAFTLTDLIE